MSSPSPSSLDSVGTSPLGSFSDPNEHPLLVARDLGLGPLVGYGAVMDHHNTIFNGGSAFSSSSSSLLHNSALSLYLNGLGSSGNAGSNMDAGSNMKDNLSLGSSGTSSRPPSGGLPGSGGCNSSSTSSSGVSSPGLATKCAVCGVGDSFSVPLPKVMPCLHALCQMCWDKQQFGDSEAACCPVCKADCLLSPPQAASSTTSSTLFKDFSAASVVLDTPATTPLSDSSGWNSSTCTACKAKEPVLAVAKCFDCASLLCTSCVLAHQFMHCFEGHRLMTLAELAGNSSSGNFIGGSNKSVVTSGGSSSTRPCVRHRGESVTLYCHTCSMPACTQCLMLEHNGPAHDIESLNEAAPRLAHQLNRTLNDARAKAAELKSVVQAAESAVNKMSSQLSKAQSDVTETYHFYRTALDERREELLRELESVYSSKQTTLQDLGHKTQEAVERILKTCSFVERLVKQSSPVDALLFKKELDAKFAALFAFCPPDLSQQSGLDVEFMSNYKAIQIGVRNTYGYIRSSNEPNTPIGPGPFGSATAASKQQQQHHQQQQQQPPIARPTSMLLAGNYSMNGVNLTLNANGRLSPSGGDQHFLAKRFPNASSGGGGNSFGLGLNELGLTSSHPTPTYEKWSSNSGGFDSFPMATTPSSMGRSALDAVTADPSLFELSKLMTSTSLYPPRSQIKRQKMIYHCKFGEFGVMEGQFTEPSGVAVNAQNDIIVADTNNHRIQIFDKEGRFKFQFGECGKRDGQLLYPNRVSVVKTSGDIIVTERSPTHQIQIYNQYGQFARKFGANVLQHPRGVTVDSKGRIIVVECKVMRVIIFDQMGNVLHKFGCSKHLEFPNGVVVNDKQEIFISDNRAHCVKVFSYEGVFLRQIGGEGLTNYPIGVGINSAGEILIADNHNNFNLTIFTQDGQLISALESKVKHAQCFDVALLDDGSVVLASKDYRLYVYRYVQIPALAL
nr:EOG090X01W2 [Ilyocryptus agilis]